MDAQQLTYLFVFLSFSLYIGIAIWSRAGSTDEFYVAGGGVHPIANGMATAADWMSAASFISMAGIIAFMGYDGTVYLMGWTGGYVILALLLAPYLRKFGEFTVPDFIGSRYYSTAARVVAVICLILISFTYVAGQMRGVGLCIAARRSRPGLGYTPGTSWVLPGLCTRANPAAGAGAVINHGCSEEQYTARSLALGMIRINTKIKKQEKNTRQPPLLAPSNS